MNKNLLCVIFLLVLFTLNAFREVEAGNSPEPHFSVFWDFYSENDIGARVWAMGGAGAANVNDLTAMVVNPAAFVLDNRFEFYFEVLSKNRNRWLKVVHQSDYYLKSPTVLPAFIGFGYKITDRLYGGLAFSSAKYYKLDLGDVLLMPPALATMHPHDIFQNRELVWSINLEVTGGIFLGGNLNYDWMSLDMRGYYIPDPFEPSTLCPLARKSDVEFVNFKLGTLVEVDRVLNFGERGKMSVGMVYTAQKSFETETKWTFGDYAEVERFGKTVLPARLEAGLKVCDLPFPVNFAGDVKYSHYSKIENLVDRWDIHLGFEWEATESIAFQLGYFTRLDYRNPDRNWLDEVGEYDQHFLTAGVRISLDDYLLQISVRDSHLLSSGLIESTQISLGAGIGF
jgi:hypothetical protein